MTTSTTTGCTFVEAPVAQVKIAVVAGATMVVALVVENPQTAVVATYRTFNHTFPFLQRCCFLDLALPRQNATRLSRLFAV